MTRVSARKLLMRQLVFRHRRAIYFSDSSDEEDFAMARAALEGSRYGIFVYHEVHVMCNSCNKVLGAFASVYNATKLSGTGCAVAHAS
jgi:hypothetical protein